MLHQSWSTGRKEGNVLFNDSLNTFYLQLYGVGHMVKYHSDSERKPGYSFRLTARVLLYRPSHRQDSTYHSLCYTSRGALAETGNSSMGPPHEGSIRRPIAPWANALTMELHLAAKQEIAQWVHPTCGYIRTRSARPPSIETITGTFWWYCNLLISTGEAMKLFNNPLNTFYQWLQQY